MTLAITARLILEDALRRGWKAQALNERFLHTLKITHPNGNAYYFDSCQAPLNSAAAMNIADNKLATYLIAQELDIPVADFCMVELDNLKTAHDFLNAQAAAGEQVVVKPIDTNHGDGITVGVVDKEGLNDALEFAKRHSSRIVLQRRHYGGDCRVLVIDGAFFAAGQRVPAYVIGDGVHDIKALIEHKNNDVARGKAHDSHLTQIDMVGAERYLHATINRVPKKGEHVTVMGTSNLSRGGEAHDITNTIHSSFKKAAERIARTLNMFICGADFMAIDHTKPLALDNAVLLEINATPGLRMHHYPSVGASYNAAAAILDAFDRKITSTNQ